MVDAHKLLRFVEDVAEVTDQSMRVETGRDVRRARRQGNAVVNAVDIGLRRRRNISRVARESGGVGSAGSRTGVIAHGHRAGSTRILSARVCQIGIGKVASPFRGRRHIRRQALVLHHPPELLRVEEERLVPAVVEMRYHHRSAHGKAEVVVAERGCRGNGRGQFVEVVVRVEHVVAEELVRSAVEVVGARFGHHVDLPAGAPAILRLVGAAQGHELRDGIHAGMRQSRHVCP